MNLIELMIVVAILGTLAMIVLPNFNNFRARAKTKEGLALGSGYYIAAKAFAAEHVYYGGNLVAVGFQPEGLLSFRIRVGDTNYNPAIGFNDDTCWRTFEPCDCGGACPNYKTWQEKQRFADLNPGDGVGDVHGSGGVTGCAMNGGTVLQNRRNFAIGVSGWVSSSATRPFRYMINDSKQIEICHDGIN